jgi:protein-tyrosine-phosphatase
MQVAGPTQSQIPNSSFSEPILPAVHHWQQNPATLPGPSGPSSPFLHTSESSATQSHTIQRFNPPPLVLLNHHELSPSVRSSKPSKQTKLNEADKIVLVQLCVENQEKYYYGNMKKFWIEVSVLLQQKTGKELKDPNSTITGMVALRRVKREQEKLESGTVQSDTQLSQALDKWIERLDSIEAEKLATTKTTEELEAEKEIAQRRRDNLLKPRGRKRTLHPSISSSTDPEVLQIDIDPVSPTTSSPPNSPTASGRIRRKRSRVFAPSPVSEGASEVLRLSLVSKGNTMTK